MLSKIVSLPGNSASVKEVRNLFEACTKTNNAFRRSGKHADDVVGKHLDDIDFDAQLNL